MALWKLAISVDARRSTPVFVQIARSISDAISVGRLRAGDRLPGARSLATSLGINRNTVVAAYRDLEAQGWIETRAARGSFVTGPQQSEQPRRFARTAGPRSGVPSRMAFSLANRAPASGELPLPPTVRFDLRGGVPDGRLVPWAELARAYRRALRVAGAASLGYGDPAGHPRLREALAQMLAQTRGLATTADDVVVTRGSQMALWLAATVLLSPGDAVAVESYGYQPAWAALRARGATLCPVDVDDRGLDVAELEALLARRRIAAVYLTPHHQFPTTAVLSPSRRLRLLELAREHRFAILEDDYDNEFHYDGRPVLPLASVDRAGAVVYVGTLSKVLAPGLRIGFAVAPKPMREALVAQRQLIDRQGDLTVEAAVAEMMEEGEVQRHIRRARRIYQGRRDVLVRALRTHLSEVLEVRQPPGGLALWAKVAEPVNVDAWVKRAEVRGVAFNPAGRYVFDGLSRPFARIGFARCTESELEAAVQLLARSLRR